MGMGEQKNERPCWSRDLRETDRQEEEEKQERKEEAREKRRGKEKSKRQERYETRKVKSCEEGELCLIGSYKGCTCCIADCGKAPDDRL